MSDPWCTIRGMENKWYKKTYVCTMCDALVEISTKSDVLRDKDCFECNGPLNLLSVADATIRGMEECTVCGYNSNEVDIVNGLCSVHTCETCGQEGYATEFDDGTILCEKHENERKQMQIVTHDSYLPHQLVTLKQITGEDVEFQLYKVTDLEVVLHDAKQRINSLTARLESQEKQIGLILDKLTADEWYSSSTDKAEVLSDLCDILNHEAKQTIHITATVEVEVDYECPLNEVEDFDAEDFLSDVLTIDTYHGDAVIYAYNVENADWATR